MIDLVIAITPFGFIIGLAIFFIGALRLNDRQRKWDAEQEDRRRREKEGRDG